MIRVNIPHVVIRSRCHLRHGDIIKSKILIQIVKQFRIIIGQELRLDPLGQIAEIVQDIGEQQLFSVLRVKILSNHAVHSVRTAGEIAGGREKADDLFIHTLRKDRHIGSIKHPILKHVRVRLIFHLCLLFQVRDGIVVGLDLLLRIGIQGGGKRRILLRTKIRQHGGFTSSVHKAGAVVRCRLISDRK